MKQAVLQESNKVAYTTHQCIKTGYISVMQNFRPPSCKKSQQYLPFNLGKVVKHVHSSFSFKHFATKAKKIDRFDFMFFDFQTRTPVSIFLYACFYLNSMICIDNYRRTQRKSENTVFFVNFHKFLCGILHWCSLHCCAFKPFFNSWVTLRRKSTAYWSCCSAKLCFCSSSTRNN